MNGERKQQKILKTLHYVQTDGESCFTANRPGLELLAADGSVLGPIETTLLEVARGEHAATSPGLDYVIGAYLVVGTKHTQGRIVPFIRSLPDSLLKRVLLNIPVFFRKVEGEYNFRIPPGAELIEFLRHLQTTDEMSMSKTAQEILAKLTARDSIPRDE